MLRPTLVALAIAAFSSLSCLTAEPLPPIPPIKRLLPPEGVKLPDEEVKKLESRLEAIEKRLQPFRDKNPPSLESQPFRTDDFTPDVEIFTKAVRFALELHEFYDPKKDVAKAHKLLDEAERRLTGLEAGTHSWTDPKGLVVLGYRSQIDDSVQPYGVVYPENFDPKKQPNIPVYVWLHGRGDKATDMHFINERMTQVGQLGAVNAIVIHPFGRQCVGFKSAGEKDVLDVMRHFGWRLKDSLGIEMKPERTVLIGFSMGGAGAWHIGAHYPHLFAAVAPGAGFAETAQYTKTDPATVPWYERKLWGMYDVPCYTRNLFNTEVIAYSGENDKQIQAARVMETAYKAEGRELTHLIGPGVAHAYEPKTLAELKRRLEEITSRPSIPKNNLYIQTKTPKYQNSLFAEMYPNSVFRGKLYSVEQLWEDTQLTITLLPNHQAKVLTSNVDMFSFGTEGIKLNHIQIDDQLDIEVSGSGLWIKNSGKWMEKRPERMSQKDLLHPGPIDDAFMERFIVVIPTGKSKHPFVQRWTEFELQHFIDRWKSLMRGEVRTIKDVDVDETKIGWDSLICFGDPDSNAVIRQYYHNLAVTWKNGNLVSGNQTWPAATHIPVSIQPFYKNADRKKGVLVRNKGYLVINSGLTFREAHDKTNSQQNPKLPDWAVLDLTQLPDDKSPGKVVKAGFFDEHWQYQEPPQDEP